MENKKKLEAVRAARNEYMRTYKENMTPEQKERKKEYHRRWREQNRDKVRKHQEDYWLRKAEKMQQKS